VAADNAGQVNKYPGGGVELVRSTGWLRFAIDSDLTIEWADF
jgi:hypothetical protein